MAACVRAVVKGLVRPANPPGEGICTLTPMVTVVLAQECSFFGRYEYPTLPLQHAPVGPCLGHVLRQAGRTFIRSMFADAFRLDFPAMPTEFLGRITGPEMPLKTDDAPDSGYVFLKNGPDNTEDNNGIAALVEAVKQKSKSLTKLLEEAESKKREMDDEDKKKRESNDNDQKEWDEKKKEAEEVRRQLRRQADLWDKITLRLLLLASRMKGKPNIVKEEEKTRLRTIIKTALIFLKGPLIAKGAWHAFEDGLALWIATGTFISTSCYLGVQDLKDLVEGRKTVVLNKASRLLDDKPKPGKCICGADLPTQCSYCGEDLPNFLIRLGASPSNVEAGGGPDGTEAKATKVKAGGGSEGTESKVATEGKVVAEATDGRVATDGKVVAEATEGKPETK